MFAPGDRAIRITTKLMGQLPRRDRLIRLITLQQPRSWVFYTLRLWRQ